MSIRRYNNLVIRNPASWRTGAITSAYLEIETPLTADASRPEVGFITGFSVHWHNSGTTPNMDFTGNLKRRTWGVKKVAAGLQRRIKDAPQTVDYWYGRRHGWEQDTHTIWMSKKTDTTGTVFTERITPNYTWSFNVETYWAMLDAIVIDNAPVEPFMDWLGEYEEFRPWFTTAGWLPTSKADFLTEREARKEAQQAALAALDAYRWR